MSKMGDEDINKMNKATNNTNGAQGTKPAQGQGAPKPTNRPTTSQAPAKKATTGEATTTNTNRPASKPAANRGPQGGGYKGNKGGYNKRGNRNNRNKNRTPKAPGPQRKFRELPEVFIYTDGMNIQDVAKKLHREPAEIIKKLFMMGIVATQNQPLDAETLELIATDYGIEAEEKIQVDISDLNVHFDYEYDDQES